MGENVGMRSSLAVAAGAALGATARWWLSEVLAGDGFPWATLIVNVLGCAAIGFVAIRLERGTLWWYFTATGLLGGLTTASAFAAETRQLVDDGRPAAAALYVIASVAGGLVATSAARTGAMRVAQP